MSLPANAQSWQFSEETGAQGVVQYQSGAVSMSFSCFVTGTPRHNGSILEWQVASPTLLQALDVPAGSVAALGLSVDGARLGDGPFQRVDAAALATSLPRDLALLTRIRAAQELRLSADAAVFVDLPLDGLDAALTDLLTFCDTPQSPPTQAIAAAQPVPVIPAAPKPDLTVAIVPLSPAELGGVIWDKDQVNLKLFIEVARRQPALLDTDQALRYWAQTALKQNNPQEDPNWRAVARDHLARSISATPPGPFVIGRTEQNPLRYQPVHEDGVLKSRYDPRYARDLGQFQVGLGSGTSLTIQAKSQFDATSLRVDAANAQRLTDQANTMGLGVATQIDEIEVIGAPQSGMRIMARGSVRFVGLFDIPQGSRNAIDSNRLVAIFPTLPSEALGTGLLASATSLGIPMYEGAILDGTLPSGLTRSGSEDAGTLARLAALKRTPPKGLSDELRNFIFFRLATQAERDAVIDPFYLSGGTASQRLSFETHVDEFERAELLERIDTLLWPHVKERMPDLPFEGIAVQVTNLGEYDRARGGFPVFASLSGMGLAGEGDFPAFRALPDLLVSSVDKARELVSYLEATNGPGNRQVMLVARYRLEDVGPVSWDDRRLPRLSLTPLSLSMHARQGLTPGENPMDLKFATFDVAQFRGPVRPVASPAQIAFWTEIDETPRSTSDDITLASIGVSENPGYMATVVANSNPVRSANEFDKQLVATRLQAELAAMEKPAQLVLDGEITLGRFNAVQRGFPVIGFSFNSSGGDRRLPNTPLELVNPEDFTWIKPVDTLAREIGEANTYGEVSLAITAWVTPELSQVEQNRTKLYVRGTRIVMRAPGDNGSGYPSGYVEIIPEKTVQPDSTARDADLAQETPSSLPLDREYIDLMMVRDAGETLSEATYARMMEDRRLREQTAAAIAYDLPWGAFFDTPQARLNPVQRRSMLVRFTAWTKARAEALPAAVYVQTNGAGGLPAGLQCWFLTPPPPDDFAQRLPGGLAEKLETIGYRQHAVNLQTFSRAAGREVSQWPALYYAVFGSPALRAARVGNADTSSAQCGTKNRFAIEGDLVQGAQTRNALISLDGGYRGPAGAPQQGRNSYFYRDYGTVAVTGTQGDTLSLALEVTRTEIIAVQQENGSYSYGSIGVLDASALPDAPLSTDVFGIEPGAPWASARAAAVERLGSAVVLENDGPPPGFRVVTQNTILGPKAEFQAFRNGHFFLDPEKREALALIREAERDADRILAVGSHRTFAEGTVTQQALIGALLRKYGASPSTEADHALAGPRPGQALSWGTRAGCLPSMRDEIRPDFSALQGQQDVRPLQNMARAFKAPSLTYSATASVIFQQCDPLVWAFVGQDAQKTMHLVVWSLDMALLDEVAKRPGPNVEADGDSGSDALIEKAADIDL